MKYRILCVLFLILSFCGITYAEGDPIDNMESNVDKMIDVRLEGDNNLSAADSLANAEKLLHKVLDSILKVLKTYGNMIAIIVTSLSWIFFWIFKSINFRSAQKTAVFFGVFTPVFYVFITYLGAFMSMIKN